MLSACGGPSPIPADPSPIVGCYIAPDAPPLNVEATRITVADTAQAFPYEYFDVAGTVGDFHMMQAPFRAKMVGNELKYLHSDLFLYLVIQEKDAQPKIVINTSFGGPIKSYQRSAAADCAS
jgi:hypothetical protein